MEPDGALLVMLKVLIKYILKTHRQRRFPGISQGDSRSRKELVLSSFREELFSLCRTEGEEARGRDFSELKLARQLILALQVEGGGGEMHFIILC